MILSFAPRTSELKVTPVAGEVTSCSIIPLIHKQQAFYYFSERRFGVEQKLMEFNEAFRGWQWVKRDFGELHFYL